LIPDFLEDPVPTTTPLNSLEAGQNSDQCELPEDWKAVEPTEPTK
jgi:hypothetical protein